MDKTNEKILLELDKNPRASFNQIGKATRISKETAQYRFKQLVKKEIITGFFAFINMAKLGYISHKILVKYRSVTKDIEKEIKNFILENPNIAWAGKCEGAWDLVITTLSQSKKKFSDFYLSFFSKFGVSFKQKRILIPINNPLFNDKYLSNGKLLYQKNIDFTSDQDKIDSIDKKILFEISKNSRVSFTEIGEKIKLNYWAVAKRYKKLISKDIIVALKPRINFRKLGYSYYHFFIELSNEKIREKIVSYYANHKGSLMIMKHLGFSRYRRNPIFHVQIFN